MPGAEAVDDRRFYSNSAREEKEKSLGMKRRVEISVETTRVLVISREQRRRIFWCADCAAEVEMLTVDEAAAVSSTDPRAIFRLLEDRKLHFNETPGSPILICPNSLFK